MKPMLDATGTPRCIDCGAVSLRAFCAGCTKLRKERRWRVSDIRVEVGLTAPQLMATRDWILVELDTIKRWSDPKVVTVMEKFLKGMELSAAGRGVVLPPRE
jgi:hypothetical protein